MKILCAFLFILSSAFAYAEPIFKSQPIFPVQDKHVHGSSIVELPNGDFLACWFHGSGERKATDVVIQGARLKKGETDWSKPFLMADTPNLPDCNPVLYIDKDKKLWLFWIVVLAEGWQNSITKYRTSIGIILIFCGVLST
jgi:predicted neuraminidase